MKKAWIFMAGITIAAVLFVATGVASASAMMGGGYGSMGYGNYGSYGGYHMNDDYHSNNYSRGYGHMSYSRYGGFGNMMNNWFRGYGNYYMNYR